MTEAETQGGQKTVVAFITGLLIGGLLVWVFSSSPKSEPTVTQNTSDQSAQTNGKTNDQQATDATDKTAPSTNAGSVTVSDQKAGAVVKLSGAKFPEKVGWVVVRELQDGNPGNILGAARYSYDESLAPKEVDLQRETKAGSTYQVVFYTDNGDKVFDLKDDKLVEGISSTFKAE